jgi:hypothetical protein
MTPIERFATCILGKPLYPYQVEAANVILHSINHNLGWLITVMMSRQSGKNQLSAVLEAFLLCTRREGVIVKAAPTFHPQVINSRRRLLSMLENPFCARRVWTSYAQVGLAPRADSGLVRRHVGPSVMLCSADPGSNVVGATADLLLEIDEAQDVSSEKFDKDFRPMASTTNATTVLYGTAWSDDTLLARQRAINLEIERQTGERRHFEYDWRAAAAANPHYKEFVESEIARLGEQHLAVQTQYFLVPLRAAGHFFNDLQRRLLAGSHAWENEPRASLADPTPSGESVSSPREASGAYYIAGLDVGGEERANPADPTRLYSKRDSTVLSIGRVEYNEMHLPRVEVVHQQWWTGRTYPQQYAALLVLCEQWNIRRLVVDNTGQGAGLASLLIEKLGPERVEACTFTRPAKSHLGYQLLALINSGRFTLYAPENAPREIFDECWSQVRAARYTLPAPETINFYVDASEGHDDFLISLALCAQALHSITQPPAAEQIRPRRLYEGESRY